MVDFGNIKGMFTGLLFNSMFWILGAIIIISVVVLVYGYYSKKGKLKYPCFELVSFGNGKIGINELKAGVFKTKSFLFGLFDYGTESCIKTNDGRRIIEATTDDLHTIKGLRGFIVRRKDDDPRILVPISKVYFKNEHLMFEIAPADYRDVSLQILAEATKETQGFLEKWMPYIGIGLCIVLCIVTVVICQQMTNSTVDKVGKILIEGCRNAQNVVPGASP